MPRSTRYLDTVGIFIIVVALLYLVSHKSCHRSGEGETIDSTYTTGTPGTVIIRDTVTKFVDRPVPYAVRHVVHDTIPGIDTLPLADCVCDSIRDYLDSLNNEKGSSVVMRASVRGEMLNWSATFNAATTTITRVDTITITKSEPERLRLAVGMGYSNQPFPYVNLSKNRLNAIAGYQLTDKSLLLGVGYQLR